MVNVLFICHGNICRSTMAEFYMKHIVNEAGLTDSIYIESAATSREEIGNDTHYGTKQKLDEMGIPYTRRKARQVTIDDYHNFDYLIIMDENNARNLRRIIGDDVDHKVHKAMTFVGESRDVRILGIQETLTKPMLMSVVAVMHSYRSLKRICKIIRLYYYFIG